MENKIKYVDLNGLQYFAEELKRYLESHVMEYSIYEELLERIQNLENDIENYTFYEVVESYDKLLELDNPQKNIIYLVPDDNNFLEYIWTDNKYEQLGSFTPELKLDDYLKKEDSPFEKGDAENSAVLKGGDNEATNANEVAIGKYNISNSDTQFSIGIGTSDTDRKNAIEVKQNGDIYIEGVKERIQDKLNTSPDWNAQVNEAGYIENKPFYKKTGWNDDSYIYINFNGEDEILVGGKLYSHEGDGQGFGYGYKYKLYFFEGTESNSPIIPTDDPIEIYCSDKNNLIEQSCIIYFTDREDGQFELIFTPHHCISYMDDSEGYYVTVKINNFNNIKYDNTFILGQERILEQKKLDVSNIEGAISYNSKQYLNTENKNQALANLGIDPVVWKYMMNPINVASDKILIIPDELKFDSGGGEYRLKYPIAAMYTFNGILPIDINASQLKFKLADDSLKTVYVGEGQWEYS